jgi:hypothetical protein
MRFGFSVLVIGVALAATATADSPFAVGDRIDAFTLEDQHGVVHTLDASVELILFSRDMAGGDLVKHALADAPADLLTTRNAIYVADITGMPKLVAKMFALPKMRKRPYPLWLDRDGAATARLPDVEGRATLIFLRDFEVTRVLHVATSAEVERELGLTR